MTITICIIVITAAVSIWAFERRDMFEKLLLSPYMVIHRKQWYRVITHGFLHADWIHLIVNMMVLYSFGKYIESYFKHISTLGALHFVFLYFGGMVAASIPALIKHREHYFYRSVGASGAVSAVLFASIFLAPWSKVLFMAIIPIPGIIFGVAYLAYSSYMNKKGGDNVAHDAHFWGAVFGFFYPILINPHMLSNFFHMLMNPR